MGRWCNVLVIIACVLHNCCLEKTGNGFRLGPESPSSSTASCPREGCTGSPSGEDSSTNSYGKESHEEGNFEVALPSKSKSLYDRLLDALQTVKENTYDRTVRMTSDIVDNVRQVVHEELYTFLQSVVTSIGGTFSSPGGVFYSLSQTAMTIILAIICLLFDYFFIRFFSLLSLLAVNCIVLLCHGVFGPEWIFRKFFWFGGHFTSVLSFAARHYYITSVIILVCFIFRIYIYIDQWVARRGEQQKREALFNDIAHLHVRMDEMERRQEEMLRILRDIDEKLEREDGLHNSS